MKIVVLADEGIWGSLQAAAPGITFTRAGSRDEFLQVKDADAFFDLEEDCVDQDYRATKSPVFINSMCTTLAEINAAANVIRMNAWPGFLEKETWELAGNIGIAAAEIMNSIHKKYITVNDEPGLVSPRIIAMIINEAFFAKGESVSSEEEIDIAMKLGTNYPFGPFEWARQIGLQHVAALLVKLSADDERYTPAPALLKELITF